MNNNSISYQARFGTVFVVNKNLRGTIKITMNQTSDNDSEVLLDCIEFGGWHGTNIRPEEKSFGGYGCLTPMDTDISE